MMNLFVENNNNTVRDSKTAIAYTAQLTQVSAELAKEFFENTVTTGDDELTARIKLAMTDNDELDAMLLEYTGVASTDVEWLKEATEDEIDRMLKSQQSKRSRSKKQTMTQDNFMKMVTGAAAEMLLRKASDKPKNQTTVVKLDGCKLTEDMAIRFKMDQESLKKAIRNVQSKKTGLRKKGMEDSPEWVELLEFEAELKALRVGGSRTTTVVKEVAVIPEEVANKAALVDDAAAIMADVENIDKLKANEAKDLLKKIQEMMAAK